MSRIKKNAMSPQFKRATKDATSKKQLKQKYKVGKGRKELSRMETTNTLTKFEDIPCCPEFAECPPCDVIDLRRRLLFPVRTERGQVNNVEVILHTRFTRCSGPFALGDPVYTTTLLPGEKVRLATTDRRSRFSFDSESNLSYRSEQMSEEQYRMSSLRAFMADQNSTDNGSSRSTDKGSWDFHGDASGSIGFMSASADANAHGSHNAESTFEYLQQHSAHASMADHLSVESTRKAHSVSVGEVSTREHKEGESQEHFESSSRVCQPEPVPRGYVPLLSHQQDRDNQVRAGLD
jgi:hypothetical protein